MSDTVISVENVSKQYRLGEVGTGTILHDVNRWCHKVLGKEDPYLKVGEANDRSSKGTSDYVWSLRDVSFKVERGEVLGVVGHNGAGKSTLLKILSRVTTPTTGEVRIKGRVASLLEVGTGFNPELTGRDNIYLNGAILGMRKREIDRKFDEIVDFSGVERYIDTPVKRYSSGMYVRLAFAVAAHLEPEILIVDEVLAVGDAEFQKKCLGKMKDVAGHGRTILFVSHNMTAISRLCRKGLFLKHGSIAFQGDAESVVTEYLRAAGGDKSAYIADPQETPLGNDIITLQAISVQDADGSSGPVFGGGGALRIEIVYHVLKAVAGLRVGFYLQSQDGTIIFNGLDTDAKGADSSGRSERTGTFVSVCHIPQGFLNRGQYYITIGSDTPGGVNFLKENIITFTIEPDGRPGSHGDNRAGLVCPNLRWAIRSADPKARSLAGTPTT